MPAPVEVEASQPTLPSSESQFSVTHQEVELEVDFRSRKLIGRATLVLQPLSKELRTIPLNCRAIDIKSVTIEKHLVNLRRYHDPYSALQIRDTYTVHQHHQIRESIDAAITEPPEPNLDIPLPKQVRVREFNPTKLKNSGIDESVEATLLEVLEDGGSMFMPITVQVEYQVQSSRDALRWVGLQEGDSRYPHVYTCASSIPGSLSCFVFPYAGLPSSRCSWKVTLKCPRTLGDLEGRKVVPRVNGHVSQDHSSKGYTNGVLPDSDLASAMDIDDEVDNYSSNLTDEEKDKELVVVCSGLMEDSDAPNQNDHSTRKWIFHCSTPVAAYQIGFAIGPFEEVNFSEFRESGKEEQLKDQAVSVHGFCLPGRADELRNTGMPLQMAIDHFQQVYSAYPFAPECQTYKLCFVDDLISNVLDTATLSICSSRLLFPDTVLDLVYENSRELIRAAASQWIGVFVTPKTPYDYWIIVGASYFMAELFMGSLWGRNELRYRQKLAADKVIELDVGRPSIYDLGAALGVDHAELDFLTLKAPLVFFILHNRLVKQSGATGVPRVLARVFQDARTGRFPDCEIWTERLLYSTDKVAHQKLATFFDQWIFGAGCPTFAVTHKFNKKKMTVEMTISQTQAHSILGDQDSKLDADNFMREVKEQERGLDVGPVQAMFTGPITVRIQEPDGRPYEHIVEIREQQTKVEFNYNTKYKRLKRNKRAKERAAAAEGRELAEDGEDEAAPAYSMGDIMQTVEEADEWRLVDWSKDDLDRMDAEAYEWIRVDKDFEWICKVNFNSANHPSYMYVSQLQQDNDVVAQMEAIQWLSAQASSAVISTVFIRTLMDSRYFYGVRTMAANGLAACALPQLDWIGLFHLEKAFQRLFCFEGSPMTRSNDFSDQRLYRIQCQIPRAIARIRDARGKAPSEVKRFFLDKLKFNDNSNNQYSDTYYVAILMAGLAETLVESHGGINFSFDEDLGAEATEIEFKRAALNEIDRLRRIDEWIPSYRNLFTLAALRGLARVIDAKVAPRRMTYFMKYTRPGNQDEVRLTAFECLINLGMLRNTPFLRYILHSFSTEPSPYVRERLWRIIGRGLGLIALGITPTTGQSNLNGFSIAEGENLESRNEKNSRTQTVEGAVKSLKQQLGENQILKEAIIDALRSSVIGLKDFMELLDLCVRLYNPVDSLVFVRKLPKYYKAEHLGNAKMRFYQIDKYRTKELSRIDLKRPRPSSSAQRSESPEAKRRRTSITLDKSHLLPPPPPPQPKASLPSPASSQPTSFSKPPAVRKPSPATSSRPTRRTIVLKLHNRKAKFATIVGLSPPASTSVLPPIPTLGSASIPPPAAVQVANSPLPLPQPAPSQAPKLKIKLKIGGTGGSGQK